MHVFSFMWEWLIKEVELIPCNANRDKKNENKKRDGRPFMCKYILVFNFICFYDWKCG